MSLKYEPASMQALANYPGDAMRSVREELSLRVAEALKAGIPRWRLVRNSAPLGPCSRPYGGPEGGGSFL